MSDAALSESFIAVGRILGFVGTHAEIVASERLKLQSLNDPALTGIFRQPTTAIAYLQAPTGWRQRVRLTMLVRRDHPLSVVVPRFEDEQDLPSPSVVRWPSIGDEREFEELSRHLAVLARSGLPFVIEKSIADRLNLDALSPRVLGLNGVQVLQRQTLRVWNTLAVWMQEYTRSPRGTPSVLRGEGRDEQLPAPAGEGAPFLL